MFSESPTSIASVSAGYGDRGTTLNPLSALDGGDSTFGGMKNHDFRQGV